MTTTGARIWVRIGPFPFDVPQVQLIYTDIRLGKGQRNRRTILFQQF